MEISWCPLPSLTRFSLKRLLRMDAEMFPLANRMPVSMASLLRSDSVKPFKNSSSCREGENQHQAEIFHKEVLGLLTWTYNLHCI